MQILDNLRQNPSDWIPIINVYVNVSNMGQITNGSDRYKQDGRQGDERCFHGYLLKMFWRKCGHIGPCYKHLREYPQHQTDGEISSSCNGKPTAADRRIVETEERENKPHRADRRVVWEIKK